MQRTGRRESLRRGSVGLRRAGNKRNGMLAVLLPLLGIVAWQAQAAESFPQLLGSVALWAVGLVLAVWIVMIWRIVFSIRFDAD